MTTDGPRRIAVFSDIHGNLHALRSVLERIDGLGVDETFCCGDVVGYGAFPNECVDLLRERGIPTTVGNHDYAAINLTDVRFFNDIARRAILWTQDQLRTANADWLRERPFTLNRCRDFLFTHASPVQPEQWGYVLTFGDVRAAFDQFENRFCFIGHSHQPTVVEKCGAELTCPEEAEHPVNKACRYLINVGSVGQPRDRNPQACFVEVDLEGAMIRFHRAEYDVGAAQEAILENGLPEELAERLAFGW